jgi:hypothetical protein
LGESFGTSPVEISTISLASWLRSRGHFGFVAMPDNLKARLALHYMFYNFGRIHKTLRVTPTMEAGKADQTSGVWRRLPS